MDEIEDEFTTDLREQIFHNNVREQIIFLLLFILLYLSSFALLCRFKRKGREDYYSTDEDEIMVYRISTWLCTFSLAVSIGAVLLLPLSIISNEVLLRYPKSYYVKWLNSSLIQGLWNYVFIFSNLSLFVLLPFAYLFTESEGFFGHRKGLMARVQETFVVLALLATALLGMTYVISALIDKDKSSFQTLLNLWSYHLPFLYSCISFLGVLMLLVCTPLGFVCLFDIVGQYLIKPQFLRDIDEEYHTYALEESCLRRRLKHAQSTGKSYVSPEPMYFGQATPILQDESEYPRELFMLRNGQLQSALGCRLTEIAVKRKLLDKQRQTSSLRRNVLYPIAMILLIGLTIITVFMVLQNTVELLIGIKALPLSSRQFTLGISSLSMLGPFGAFLEIVLILYLIATSAIGLYSFPPMSKIRPTIKSTPFGLVIGNCALILLLSSALPLLSKILGITNFDLLGDYGSIEWLGNFKIVLMYNIVFAMAASLCVANKFTAKVRRELYARLLAIMGSNHPTSVPSTPRRSLNFEKSDRFMAHFVIAGKPDCPAFVHVLHVARYLDERLPNFDIQVIQKRTGDWEPWLEQINWKNHWHHSRSPLIWKELSKRGGKVHYVGSVGEFWEYCYDYYGLESLINPENLQKLVADNLLYFNKMEKLEKEQSKNTMNIGVIGVQNSIFPFFICELIQMEEFQKYGGLLVKLHDIQGDYQETTDFIEDITEDIQDLIPNGNQKPFKVVDQLRDLLEDIELLIILGDYTRKPDETEREWLIRNMSTMLMISDEVNVFAKRNLRIVLALHGPVCYAANILMESCTAIRIQNIVAVTSDVGLGPLQRAAEQAGIQVGELGAAPVWGFVGINEFVDVQCATIKCDIYRPYQRVLKNKGGSTLTQGIVQSELRCLSYLIRDVDEIMKKATETREAIKKHLKRLPTYAKVRATINLLKLWYSEDGTDDIISLGVCSDGSHDIPAGLVFSQPVTLERGLWKPFKNFPVINKTQKEIKKLVSCALEIIEGTSIDSYRCLKSSSFQSFPD